MTVGVTQWDARRTSRSRHLLSLLSSRFGQISHDQRPVERLPHCWAGNVSTGIPSITDGPSLLSTSYSSPPTACLTISLPKGRRVWVIAFHTVDPMDDLGVPSTPVVQQFRAGSYETCILTTSANTG